MLKTADITFISEMLFWSLYCVIKHDIKKLRPSYNVTDVFNCNELFFIIVQYLG